MSRQQLFLSTTDSTKQNTDSKYTVNSLLILRYGKYARNIAVQPYSAPFNYLITQ